MANQNEIIQYNQNQDIPIKLDLTNNKIILNQDVDKILSQGNDIVKKGTTLLKTNIDQIDEAEMTKLNKEIRPISKIQNDYLNTRKSIKKQLQNRDDAILAAFDQKLNENHFDEIQTIVKKLRVLQKDFKANRGNQRWEQLKKYFNAQMQLYPELQKYAPTTLGNFEYYRINHPNLVSEAKTKPVNDETIETLNQNLYDYHNDLKHLFNSNLNSIYYQPIIEQYGAEPSTNKMLELIQAFNIKQLNDQNQKQIQKIENLAKTKIKNLWFENPKVNEQLNKRKPDNINQLKFQNQKQNLMNEAGDAIFNSIQATDFIDSQNEIDQVELTNYIKTSIKKSFQTINQKLQTPITTPIETQPTQSKTESKHQWLLEYLQANHWENIHDNDKIKAQVLRDLFTTINNPQSVWRNNINSNHEIVSITKFITNL